jgi:hypothetical protein
LQVWLVGYLQTARSVPISHLQKYLIYFRQLCVACRELGDGGKLYFVHIWKKQLCTFYYSIPWAGSNNGGMSLSKEAVQYGRMVILMNRVPSHGLF